MANTPSAAIAAALCVKSGICICIFCFLGLGSVLVGYRRENEQVAQEPHDIDGLVSEAWFFQEEKCNSIEPLESECRGKSEEQQITSGQPEFRKEPGCHERTRHDYP